MHSSQRRGLIRSGLSITIILTALSVSACVVAPARQQVVYRTYPVYVQPPQPAPAYVEVAPPPPQVEYIPVSPFPGAIWVGGHWGWAGGRHSWNPGHYVRPVEQHRFVPHRWENSGGRWVMRGGFWIR